MKRKTMVSVLAEEGIVAVSDFSGEGYTVDRIACAVGKHEEWEAIGDMF